MLSANVISSWNSRLQHSGVSARLVGSVVKNCLRCTGDNPQGPKAGQPASKPGRGPQNSRLRRQRTPRQVS